ncbi:spore germination protein GerW family protein [Spirilliplanes yamanashiensis]|uniref:Sporulation protein YtfJ n=1 Tax=Spirilliplanes yamanashiensis TaxID=42233 RepID=A0A8J4DLT3_9ACTN|nr:spore germination protein GerW family protein [Spirilliplanes yamanashiensis]MDP9818240.1 putative spore protein YtfJ [Spirilliplanes yamanashiensis]GIJ06732.1 hypothetical protein Sya03_60840 [Spirilliplanes yamanashiensis]
MTQQTALADVVREAIGDARADRAFGTPVVRDGVVVLPVARVGGGGGGGSGTGITAPAGAEARGRGASGDGSGGGSGSGSGGGMGMSATPLGVFVLKDGTVRWRPAVDVNRIIAGGQLVAVVALLVVRALGTARSTQRVHRGRWTVTRRRRAGFLARGTAR